MRVWGEKEEGKKARLGLMHVRAAGAAEQGQKASESVWGRNKGSMLHGSVPQLGGTLSHSYEVWPPQTIKSPITLSDFFETMEVNELPEGSQVYGRSDTSLMPETHDPLVRYWYALSEIKHILSLHPDTSFKIWLFRGQAIFVEPPRTVHSSVSHCWHHAQGGTKV